MDGFLFICISISSTLGNVEYPMVLPHPLLEVGAQKVVIDGCIFVLLSTEESDIYWQKMVEIQPKGFQESKLDFSTFNRILSLICTFLIPTRPTL